MNHLLQKTATITLFSTLMIAAARAETSPEGYVDFGKLSPSVAGGEFVEVHIKSNLIEMVARLAEKAEPQAADLLRGLKLIRVNVIGLKDDNRSEVTGKVKAIRDQLTAKGWERIVTAQEPKQDVSVFLKTRGSEAVEGLVVTVIDGERQAVLVNVVGDIKPEKISEVGQRLNIDPLKKLGPALEKHSEPKKQS